MIYAHILPLRLLLFDTFVKRTLQEHFRRHLGLTLLHKSIVIFRNCYDVKYTECSWTFCVGANFVVVALGPACTLGALVLFVAVITPQFSLSFLIFSGFVLYLNYLFVPGIVLPLNFIRTSCADLWFANSTNP